MMNMIPDDIMRNHIIPYKLDLESRDKIKNQLKKIQKCLNELEDNFVSDLSDLILEYDCVLLEKQETVVCNYLHEIYLEERMEQIKRELFCYLMDNKKIITEKLLAEYGESSNIEFLKDPSIMGGLSIKIGDETLDLSIRGKVKKLVNQLNF